MSHKLDDIVLDYHSEDKNKVRAFVQKQFLIAELYVYYLENYKPPKTSRINIFLGADNLSGYYFGSIFCVNYPFKEDEYWKAGEEEKNRILLDIIHSSSLLGVNEYSWDIAKFENAYRYVIKKNFRYSIENTRKYSKNKKYKGAIILDKNEKFATVSVGFFSSSDELIRKVELIKTRPEILFHHEIYKGSKWLDNNNFGYQNKSQEITIKASIETGKSEIILNPKQSSLERLQSKIDFASKIEEIA